MILKKMLVLLLSLVMVFSFAACGGEAATEPTPTEDPAVDAQTLDDADYEQLTGFAQQVNVLENNLAAIGSMKEELLNGTITAEDVIAAYKTESEASALLYNSLSEATWQTDAYAEPAGILLSAAEALYLHDASMYEAVSTDNANLMEESETYYATYMEQMDAFYTLMGV